ncbi:MAG TPA: copper resistance CopC family protein [Ktedonobacterales bacterium]|nr:copper resistance CopC family protein [Ktedonobacterales bacterium]
MHATILSRPLRLIPALGLLAALAAALAAPPALARPAHAAHAGYVSSDPAANAVLKAAPSTVVIHFAEPVDPAGSGVTVYNAKGQVVSGAAQVEQNDLATMRAPMTGDDSEVYLVAWHTVSATDGDPDVGAFSFFVSETGASDLAPKTSPTTTAQATGGAPAWLVALIAIVALLAGLAGGYALARRVGRAGLTGRKG